MENKAIYPSVSQKIQGQSCLLQRHFQDSLAISHGAMRDFHGMNWRRKGALLPEPFLGKESSSSVTPMPITIGAPAEKRYYRTPVLLLICQSALLTFVAPIQRVQLLLQNQNATINSGRLSHPYSGILNCFSRTIKNEGLFSLWRSNGALLMAFYSKEIISSCCLNALASSDLKDPGTRILVLFIGSCAKDLLIQPFIYAQTRLANDVISNAGQRQFSGVFDVCRKTIMTDGVRGLYRGLGISMAAFWSQHVIRDLILPAKNPRSISYQSNFLPVEDLQKHLDGLFAAMVVYPMITVSRRMMMSSGEGEIVKFKSTLDAFSQILKKEGVKAFYKGGGAEILKLTMAYCLVEALSSSLTPKNMKKKKTGEERGNPAPNSVKLTWRNANVGSHKSEK